MSNNKELKNGDNVYVSDISCESYIFIGINNRGYFVVENHEGSLLKFCHAAKVPEPEVTPWTFETCPLPPFAITPNDEKNYVKTVLSIELEDVYDGHRRITYQELFDNYDYIVSRDDIRPCGELKCTS